MPRVDLDHNDYLKTVTEGLQHGGLVIVGVDGQGRPNPMTIGWAFVGPSWGRQVFVTLVRPSRHTFALMEETGEFTVNVLPKGFESAISYCGSKSGRDGDKFSGSGLTAMPSRIVKAPTIGEAVLCLECRVVEKVDLDPGTMDPAVRQIGYAKGDFHRLYFGEILAAYGDPDKLG